MSEDDHGLDATAQAALAALLDELVPPRPDGRLPGAGGLGLVAELLRALRERPPLRAVVAAGLAALEAIVRARGASLLSELPPAERSAALQELTVRAPAFVPTLCFVTYVAYYQDPRVLAALGREPRPPFPKGHELASGDLSRLAAVRARGPIYRAP